MTEYQGLIEALEYYAEKARAVTRYMKVSNTIALQAIIVELSIDGGSKADTVLNNLRGGLNDRH